MKKTTKRIVSILLALLMLVSGGAVLSFAADDVVAPEELAEYGSQCEVTDNYHENDNVDMIVLRNFSCVEDMNALFNDGKTDHKNYVQYYCAACGKTIYHELDKAAAHTLEEVKGKEATCIAEGIKTYYECKVCHKKFEDKEGTKAVAKDEDLILIKVGHTDNDGDGWCDVEDCKYEIKAHCRYCGEVHPDNFIGKITAFFHSILATFGLKK